MKKKVICALLCAAMTTAMVTVPGVAVHAEEKKLIGRYYADKRFAEMESGRRKHEKRAGSSRI